jgi:hypothetical protein
MRAAHQGFDLQLTRYDERELRTTFYTIGMEHSPTSDGHRVGARSVARGPGSGAGRVATGRGEQHQVSHGVNAKRGYDFGARLSSSQSWKHWTCN